MLEHEVSPRKDLRKRWAETRRRGAWSYIIRRGILIAGLLFATLRLIDNYFGFFPGSHWHGLWPETVSFIFAAHFFGTVMGWWAWRYRERQFTKPSR
jgi:hypothetical protein